MSTLRGMLNCIEVVLTPSRYPWFLETWDAYPFNIERADAIRYFVLAHYGGVYIDLDDVRPALHITPLPYPLLTLPPGVQAPSRPVARISSGGPSYKAHRHFERCNGRCSGSPILPARDRGLGNIQSQLGCSIRHNHVIHRTAIS